MVIKKRKSEVLPESKKTGLPFEEAGIQHDEMILKN